jgi:hypothetical protein
MNVGASLYSLVREKGCSVLTKREEPPKEKQRRRLRLCFFIGLTIWTFATRAALFVLFYFTRGFSFPFLLPLAPPVVLWYRFATYLLRR